MCSKTADGQVITARISSARKTSLTVSGQLNAENFAMAFGDVYLWPHLPGGEPNTQRHAAEF